MTSEPRPATTVPLTSAQQAEVERQHALIMRGTRFGDAETRATMERELRARLAASLQDERPLRVYFGVDPTAPDLHLGHCVPLRKLRTFQQLGHHAILLIGDFTAQIGDASDKDALRPMHAAAVIAANARTYQDQAFKLLDRARTEVVHNADWLGTLTFQDVVGLASNFTVAQFIERDNFRKRLDRGEPVFVHEFMYGLMQGYDAVELRADVQVGGTEQTFNIMAGRILQRVHAQAPQVAITSPILVGLDGKERMSKSAGNHIGIDEPPGEQYGKAMSIPDDALVEFYTLGTNLEPGAVDGIGRGLGDGSLHPMAAKKRLAHAIVAEWHGEEAADAAADGFARVFSQREQPDEMPEVAVPIADGAATVALAGLLTRAGVAESKSEVKRLIAGGSIQLDGERVTRPEISVVPGSVLKVGKRRWLRIVAE
ncbi:MAG: tyrosyl-tRNA synthetase [Chloroflexi bacterium]|nr:MAG: tyrosyl-tRNA synthetase [Chloroflexota bacterium]